MLVPVFCCFGFRKVTQEIFSELDVTKANVPIFTVPKHHNHSLKNRIGSPVGPEKTRTGDLTGSFSALDRSRQQASKNRENLVKSPVILIKPDTGSTGLIV